MPLRIIVADDDEDVLSLLEEIMRDSGYAVTAVTNGTAVLDAFTDQPFDVVVTDMRMPSGDGVTVLDGVRRLRPATPVIVITGYSDYDEAALRAKGAFCCLRKPLRHLADLPTAVTDALGTGRDA